MGDNKKSSRWMNSVYAPKFTTKDFHTSLPRSRGHNGSTNPRNKPQLKATQKHNSRSKRLRQPAKSQADGPCGLGGWSKNRPRTSSFHPPKFGRSVSSPRTVRSSRTIRPHRVDSPANNFQPKPTDRMDRNKAEDHVWFEDRWMATSLCDE
jgi:hypothetical protein